MTDGHSVTGSAPLRRVGVLIGSLRRDSLCRKIAQVAATLAPEGSGLDFEVIEIGELPLYNPDLDVDPVPASWARLRAEVRAVDALLFVTPEYNRSVPACLKNALDVGSRPFGQGVWQKKPGAIISVSPGAMGGFGANHHLRQSLVFLDVPLLQQPEAYLGGAGAYFDAEGRFVADRTRELLQRVVAAFADWIARVGRDAS
ncbi:MAG: NAD(P)H-dependent oxidoreductase [Myxococcales bacterium]|nr:NAD(P)H-dependent oxidoreductase [Myxococcales bacterium]